MLAGFLVALVVGAAAGLRLISKHREVNGVGTAAAAGDGIYAVAFVSDLVAALLE